MSNLAELTGCPHQACPWRAVRSLSPIPRVSIRPAHRLLRRRGIGKQTLRLQDSCTISLCLVARTTPRSTLPVAEKQIESEGRRTQRSLPGPPARRPWKAILQFIFPTTRFVGFPIDTPCGIISDGGAMNSMCGIARILIELAGAGEQCSGRCKSDFSSSEMAA